MKDERNGQNEHRIRVTDPLIPMFAETLDGRGNFSLVKRKALGPVQDNWRLAFVPNWLFRYVEIAIVVPCRLEKPLGIVQLLDDGVFQCDGQNYGRGVLISEVEWDATTKQFKPRLGTDFIVRGATSKVEAQREYRRLRKKLDDYTTRLAAQTPPSKVQPFNEYQNALLAALRCVYTETVKALKIWNLALRQGSDDAGLMRKAVKAYLVECNRYSKKPTLQAKQWMIYNWHDRQLDKMPAVQLAKELTSATRHRFTAHTAHKLRERMNLATHLKPGPPPRYLNTK